MTIEEDLDAQDFILAPRSECIQCGEDCTTIEVNFEAYLHLECLDDFVAGWMAANLAAGPVTPW